MKTMIKLVLFAQMFYLLAAPMAVIAQSTNYGSDYLQRDSKHYISAHDNNKYHQQYLNYNGKIYECYNKTYEKKSKDLTFYEITVKKEDHYNPKRAKLFNDDHGFLDYCYFDKDDYMSTAFFGAGDFLFVVVNNKDDNKPQLYRWNISTPEKHGVYIDLNTPVNYNYKFHHFTAAVTSGNEVMLFCEGGVANDINQTRYHGFVAHYTFTTAPEPHLQLKDFTTVEPWIEWESAIAIKTPYGDSTDVSVFALRSDGNQFAIDEFIMGNTTVINTVKDTWGKSYKNAQLISGRSQSSNKNSIEEWNPDNTYISVFFTGTDTHKKDKNVPYSKRIPIYYGELILSPNHENKLSEKLAYVSLFSDDHYAKNSDDALLNVFENYEPVEVSNHMNGPDGMQKQNILVSCDKNNETNYAAFWSDYYVIHDEIPPSSDMSIYDDDPELKKTWTLLGIIDGPPPCAVKWDEWEEATDGQREYAPTELIWQTETEKTVSTSVETETSWSIGASVEGEIPIGVVDLGIDVGGKYAKLNKQLNDNKQTIKVEFEKATPLTEELQGQAIQFWLAPDITRYTYSVFDWSDTKFQQPVNGLLDYSFVTNGYKIKTTYVPISNAPHSITNPNDSLMSNWVDRAVTIDAYAREQGESKVNYLSYDMAGGSSASLSKEDETTNETTDERSLDIDLSASLKIPEICTVKGSYSHGWKTTTSTKVSTTFSKSFKFSSENLVPKYASYIYPKQYDINIYFFTPDKDWWYYDDTEGFKPWYIAYTVVDLKNKSKALLSLAKPENNEVMYLNETVNFSWADSLQGTKLVISKSPSINKAIIYNGELSTQASEAVSKLGVGEYYWRVGGLDNDGLYVWSDFRKFTIVEKEFLVKSSTYQSEKNTATLLSAKVYPNPSHLENVSLTYEIKDGSSPLVIILYNINGQKVWEKTYEPQGTGIFNQEIQTDKLNTSMGILKIINGAYYAVEKLVVY